MAWTHHRLKFRLLSPMHIGYRKVGNLMQTRHYVPGKNLWAALTARLTRDFPDKEWNRGYKAVGRSVAAQFRFGYLWPSLDGNTPCYFWEREDFDYLFLDSYASTALDYSAHSSKEGSLHETEFIAPVARNGMSVYLLGDLWEKEGEIAATSWQSSMKNLQLGGERTYGWGRLSLCSDLRGNGSENEKTATGHRCQEGGEVVLTLNKGDRITAHALAASSRLQGSGHDSRCIDEILASVEAGDGGLNNNVEGPVEPMVGREWSAFAGQKVCYSGVYFMPGCKIKDANDQAKFIIDAFGRWISYKR